MKSSGGITHVNTISYDKTKSYHSKNFQSQSNEEKLVSINTKKNQFFEEEEGDIDSLFPNSSASNNPFWAGEKDNSTNSGDFNGPQDQNNYTRKINTFFDA